MAPVMRPSLATVLQQDPFNVAITEAVAEGETKVKKLWESFGKGADGTLGLPRPSSDRKITVPLDLL